jgi:hypothetical protein
MSTPGGNPPPDEDRDFDEADRQWFDHLSGRPTRVTDQDALRESRALRRAIQLEDERAAAAAPADQAADERALQRLLFAARSERLLGSGDTAHSRRRWGVAAALAATLLIGVVSVGVRLRGDGLDEPPVMRGQNEEQVIIDADPKARANTIVEQVKGAGLSVHLYRHGRDYVVDIEVPPERFDAVAGSLERAGLTPHTGVFRVRIRAG